MGSLMAGDTRYPEVLVRDLLLEQHPDLADLTLREVDGGWDNQLWRLGADLAARLPRTEGGPALLRNEQLWLPSLAAHLPLPVPAPARLGEPSALFAHPWSVTRWVAGTPADREPITAGESACRLAEFLVALHVEAPTAAPTSATRGVPLIDLDSHVSERFSLLADHPLLEPARAVWRAAVTAPPWDGPRLWVHGDLHPANVVVRGGALTGVLDFGDMFAGDPACDLAAAWVLLPDNAARGFVQAYGRVDDATVTRARGWAVLRALVLIMIGVNGRLGRPGGKPTWEPAGYAALERCVRRP